MLFFVPLIFFIFKTTMSYIIIVLQFRFYFYSPNKALFKPYSFYHYAENPV